LAFSNLCLITNRARRNEQYACRYGYGIQITHFCVGNQGHDPESPISALTPDPNYDPTPAPSGDRLPSDATIQPLAISGFEDDPYFATVYLCNLPKGVATGVISSLYLLAKFVLPVTHPEYNKLWIYSMAYTPLSVKTDVSFWSLRLGTQY
jgi:hypothetical protein